MSVLRVGLTGGLAAGKSTVAQRLRAAGIAVVDADQVVANLYAPGGAGARAVAALFGDRVLDEKRAVHHARLAERVFSDDGARLRLELAIHPLVKAHFERIAEETDDLVVLEAPLLVEAGFHTDCDLVITVEAEPEQRLEWAVARGLDREQAQARIAAQTEESVRVAAADLVFRNEGSLSDLEVQADALAGALRKLAAEGAEAEVDA